MDLPVFAHRGATHERQRTGSRARDIAALGSHSSADGPELLLAQSSDWAFLIKNGTAREYATKRTTDHLLRFNRLHDDFAAGRVDEKFLCDCEWRDNLFPNINWRYYL